MTQQLVFLPLGGVGEIGMNLYLYGLGPEDRREWLMVDLGITFPGDREPGVDVVLPDIRFIEEERGSLAGILLTHGHEDHFGAVVELWPRLRAPVYATAFTAAMLRAKLAEVEWGEEVPVTVVEQGARFDIGAFDVELVTMAHSIPETNAVAIRGAGGLVLHSADWKLDPEPGHGRPTDEDRLRALGREGVDVLICDSTSILVDGPAVSERQVADSFKTIISRAKRRVAITTFASNVARLIGIARAAKAAGRHVVVAGRAMRRIVDIARDTGLWPEDLEVLSDEAFADLPADKVVALCTGSQGEPRAALARIADGEHPAVVLERGDLAIFSSRTIPGNEQAVIRVLNKLADLGVEVMSEWEHGPIHASGHPRRGEVARLYDWVKPGSLVAMHGESRHLEAHGRFARAHGIEAVRGVRNGDMVRLLPGPAEIIDEAPVGRIYRDGRLLVPAEEDTVYQRRRLSFVGTVTISLVMNRAGELAADPQIAALGLPREDADGEPFEEIILKAVFGAFGSIPRARRKNAELAGEAVRRSVRAAVNGAWGKKTLCTVLVTVV